MAEQAKVFPKPVDWDELYPGRFLKASDFKGKNVTLRVKEVNLEELVGDKGAQVKGVVSFEKTEKQLALNKTNGICMKEMFGKKVQEWVGKRVTLFASVWNGEDCIRVFGSPDIAETREITVQLPRKRPIAMTMHKVEPVAKAVEMNANTRIYRVIENNDLTAADAIYHLVRAQLGEARAPARVRIENEWTLPYEFIDAIYEEMRSEPFTACMEAIEAVLLVYERITGRALLIPATPPKAEQESVAKPVCVTCWGVGGITNYVDGVIESTEPCPDCQPTPDEGRGRK